MNGDYRQLFSNIQDSKCVPSCFMALLCHNLYETGISFDKLALRHAILLFIMQNRYVIYYIRYLIY